VILRETAMDKIEVIKEHARQLIIANLGLNREGEK
jgi:hypothetical protein